MGLISTISMRLGYSPKGKAVQIYIDESAFPELVGASMRGRVMSLLEDGAAVIALDVPLILNMKDIKMLRACPRHEGYDFYHMAIGAIATDLSYYIEGAPFAQEDRFAMGLTRARSNP